MSDTQNEKELNVLEDQAEQIERILKACFDIKKRTFKTSKGVILELQEVNADYLYAVARSITLPEPPLKTITIKGGSTQTIEDYDDPQYQQAFGMAYIEQRKRQMFLLFNEGIKNRPDEAYIRLAKKLGASDPEDVQYMWVLSLLGEEINGEALSNAITRQTMPLPEEVEKEVERFPDTSEDSEGDVVTHKPHAKKKAKPA